MQVASINDISESNQRAGSTGSAGRLLRIRLTDGHSSLTAIEHRPVPSLSLDISPGTKVGTDTFECAVLLTLNGELGGPASPHFATCESGMAKARWMKHRPLYTLATVYQIMSHISIPLDTLGHKKIYNQSSTNQSIRRRA